MRTGVASTSRDAYQAIRPQLSGQQARLTEYLQDHRRGYTRAELAQATGLRLSAVCGRVNELVKAGVLVQCPRRPCSITGSAAHPVRLAPEQLALV